MRKKSISWSEWSRLKAYIVVYLNANYCKYRHTDAFTYGRGELLVLLRYVDNNVSPSIAK